MYFQKLGSGNAVLFLHGWGCDGSVFLPVAKQVSCACYLVDFAGFGNSPCPPVEGWSVGDYATDLWHFVQEQNLQNVTIVAHSFGCRVATVFAKRHPRVVKNMLFVAPAGIRRFSLKRSFSVAKFKFQKLLHRLKIAKLPPKSKSTDYANCPNCLKNTFVKVVNQDLSHYVKLLQCPVVVVASKSDKQVPLWQAKRFCALNKRCQLVQIDGDHFAYFANPRAFALAVETLARDV